MLVAAGGRGAGKDINQDVREAAQSLERYSEMLAEEIPQDSPPTPFHWIPWLPCIDIDQPVFKDDQWIRIKTKDGFISKALLGNGDMLDWSFDLGYNTIVAYCLLERCDD
jgi:hypothetical protein